MTIPERTADPLVVEFDNTLADGEELVYINAIAIGYNSSSSSSSNVTYTAETVLIINGVEYTIFSQTYTQKGTDSPKAISALKAIEINLFSLCGTTIRAGDTVSLRHTHTKTTGSGYNSGSVSSVSLTGRIVKGGV